MKLTTIVKKHLLTAYFVLAYGIAWIGSVLALGPKFLRAEPTGLSDTPLVLLAMLAGPSLAGVALTALLDGRHGLKDLLARMGRYRVGLRWYAAAILIPPVLILALLVPLSIVAGPQFAPGFVPIGLLVGLIAGFIEEIGWSGYAFPRMKALHGALVGAICLGLLHSTWHIVADFLGSSQALGET